MMTPTRVRSLEDWTRLVHEQLRANFDVVVLITGKPGVGKSNFANFLAHRVDPTFNLERTFFSGRMLIWGSERAPKHAAVVWDEIVEGGLAIEALTGENREVLKHLITGRSLNLVTLACAPKLKLFQGFTKEDRAQWWIHLPKRGTAVFHHVSDENPYPKAKPYYPQQFILTGIPPMDPVELAQYEKRKEDWRGKWHRDSNKLLRVLSAHEAEEKAIKRLMRDLAWLPASVQRYADAFPGHKGSLKPWEKRVQQRLRENERALAPGDA